MTNKIKAVFFDLSGVLYEGDTLIPGAIGCVDQLRDQEMLLRFVTNTATLSHQGILTKLKGMGLSISPEELFTAPNAAKAYIQQQNLRPLCIIHHSIKTDFDDINQREPNCVLLGDAREQWSYENLNHAFQLCQQGAPLVGIGMNKYYKTESGLQLDAGPFIQAIAWAADTKPIIMGKPSAMFFEQVVASTPYSTNECLMIGDDALADVKGAMETGLQGLLVKTGKYQSGDEELLPNADLVINTIADFLVSHYQLLLTH